jgi:hypothetical protein
MTSTMKSSGQPLPNPIPAELSAGLDLFAAAWLEQWCKAGGFVSIDQQGKAWIGHVEYHDSPDCAPPPDGLPDAVNRAYDGFLDGRYHGKMLSMLDLLKALPHGLDALKGHMRAHGIKSYSRPAINIGQMCN